MIKLHTKFEVSMSPTTKMWKATQNTEFGVVLGKELGVTEDKVTGTMSPFDGAQMTSYSTLIETMRLSLPFSSYSELFVKSRLF